MTAAFEAIEATWGGVDRYLAEGLGLTPETLARLRDRLLD
ncbi:tyrosine-protein phosphatase [Streptomyces goshikiensis]